MLRTIVPLTLLLTAFLPLSARADEEPGFSDGEVLFALKVKPLLVQKCFACHGGDPERIEGELTLTSRDDLLRGGESGETVLEPGNAAGSLLYTATTWKDVSYQMPPKEADRLTEDESWQLREWIDGGAPWPDAERLAAIIARHDEGVTVRTSGGLSEEWTNRRYDPKDLWAYRPLIEPAVPSGGPVPEGRGEERPGSAPDSQPGAPHPVDAFIREGLNALGIEPAPPADRRMLIRRASYDLLGLPPVPEDVEAFLDDRDSDAVAFLKVIDRLLESPHYGERWGRHWLDVVRYADSSGFSNDFERPNAWRYRDYVVGAFNSDKPFDEFIREQIAGDELDQSDPEKMIAAGFLRMGPWEQTGMSVAKETRQQFLDDVTDAVGQVFLSHPMQCCRCHDHKFDPLPTRDYYSLQAVFATTQFAEREAPFLDGENRESFEKEQKYLKERIERYRSDLKELNEKEAAAARTWYAERGLEYAPRRQKLQQGVPESELAPRFLGFDIQDRGMERIARKYLQRHEWEMDKFRPVAFSVYSGLTRNMRNVSSRIDLPENPLRGGELERTAILGGGDPFSPTEPVRPGALSVVILGRTAASQEVRETGEDRLDAPPLPPIPEFSADITGRRTALAEWITDPDNPLTSRSIVNRVWQWHFGQGIVQTPNNFGKMGKKPTHPELLEWLAVRFIESGWSIKSLHRLIMTSEAYRRSSVHPDMKTVLEKDPDLTAYALFQPRRLTAEELRDSFLSISGELNPELGGLPVRPDMNLEVALQPRQIMGTYAPTYQASPLPSQRHRRSLYAVQIRGLRDPFMEVFNQPGSETSCEVREASTITPQVFALFNAETSYDRAAAMAVRLLEEVERSAPRLGEANSGSPIAERQLSTDEDVIRRAFVLAYGRDPSDGEIEACLAHWHSMTGRHKTMTVRQATPPTEVTRRAVEEMSGETFELTEELETFRDYVPDVKFEDVDARTRGLAEVCLVLMNSNEFAYVP